MTQATMGGEGSGWWRGRTMEKENTIARRNGGMHFLLVGARQRCPTGARELFEGYTPLIPGTILPDLPADFLRKIQSSAYGISKANLRGKGCFIEQPMNGNF